MSERWTNGVDLQIVVGEIRDEVRRRRKAGEVLPSFEGELDRTFAEVTSDSADGGFRAALDLAERLSCIDVEVPMRSNIPGGELVKRGLRRLMSWYVDYVVGQMTRSMAATTTLIDLLEERMSRLEADERYDNDEDNVAPPFDHQPWASLVVSSLSAQKGPVLHADCGDGSLLAALEANGVRASGVDTRVELLDRAAVAGLDVRHEDAVRHLQHLSDGELGGVVLSSYPDVRKRLVQQHLVELTRAKLSAGGVVVLLGTSPQAWERRVSVVAADLSTGRPLHAETWRHLFKAAGFDRVVIHDGKTEEELAPVPAADAHDALATAMSTNFAKLDELLFGPSTFAVVGVRGR